MCDCVADATLEAMCSHSCCECPAVPPPCIGLCGLCLSPFLLVPAVVLLGLGEQRAVCRAKAIDHGRNLAVEVGCSDVREGAGDLVIFSCDLQPESLQPARLTVDTGLFDVSSPVACLKTTSRMMQCKEGVDHTRRRRTDDYIDHMRRRYYTYSMEWVDKASDDRRRRGGVWNDHEAAEYFCGSSYPAEWDPDVPATNIKYATVMAGNWTIKNGLESTACDTQLNSAEANLKAGNSAWSAQASSNTVGGAVAADGVAVVPRGSTFTKGNGSAVGDYEVIFSGNDWSNPGVIGLGRNANGVLENWTADSDWLCRESDATLYEVRAASQDAENPFEQLFSDLDSESWSLTWIVRALGLVMLWLGLMLAGLMIAGGDCCLACCGAGLPACSCCLLVIAICWAALRPMVGIPCLLLSCCAIAAFGGGVFGHTKKPKEDAGYDSSSSSSSDTSAPAFVQPHALPTHAHAHALPQARRYDTLP